MITSLLNRLRSLARSLGLLNLLKPLVLKYEAFMISRLGGYTTRVVSPGQTEIASASGKRLVMGPPACFASLALEEHERPMLVTMLNFFDPIAEGRVIWDIGANMGFYTALLGRFAGDTGKVVAFEPNPSTYDELCSNLTIAGCANISPVMIGLSDHDGDASMVDTGESFSCSLERVREGSKTFLVQIASGDSLVARGVCPQPELIKMDIEGHELKALRGMKATISNPHCRLLLCEVHFSILDNSGEKDAGTQVDAMLKAAGFNRRRWLSRSHLLAQKL